MKYTEIYTSISRMLDVISLEFSHPLGRGNEMESRKTVPSFKRRLLCKTIITACTIR